MTKSRVLGRLDELYAVCGPTRPGYSHEEDAAHELAATWMREAGLEVSRDEAGNLFGRRGARELWTGSHLDSVPGGGRFDGALGVVAAIEAAARLPDIELAVVAFRAEETGPMGSRRLVALPEAFVELHIEQGPVLERLGEPLGIVTGVIGQARGAVTFEGRAAHAGTAPMDEREDALVEAAKFILRVRESPHDGALATVGALEIIPGAMNVVPERVTVAVDARAPTAEALDALIEAIGFEPTWRLDPVPMGGAPFEALQGRATQRAGARLGRGHDAMVLAAAGVPTAMLFVRSLNGGAQSLAADELSGADDIELAVDALADTLRRL